MRGAVNTNRSNEGAGVSLFFPFFVLLIICAIFAYTILQTVKSIDLYVEQEREALEILQRAHSSLLKEAHILFEKQSQHYKALLEQQVVDNQALVADVVTQIKSLKQSGSNTNSASDKTLQLALIKLNSLVNKLSSASQGQIELSDLDSVTDVSKYSFSEGPSVSNFKYETVCASHMEKLKQQNRKPEFVSSSTTEYAFWMSHHGPNDLISRYLQEGGQWAQKKFTYFSQWMTKRPGTDSIVFFDFGGHVGELSLFALASQVDVVYYFEPHRRSVMKFCESLSLNDEYFRERARVINAAVGEKKREGRFCPSETNVGASVLADSDDCESVQVLGIDDWMQENGIQLPDHMPAELTQSLKAMGIDSVSGGQNFLVILDIDIIGSEGFMFEGARKLLLRSDYVYITVERGCCGRTTLANGKGLVVALYDLLGETHDFFRNDRNPDAVPLHDMLALLDDHGSIDFVITRKPPSELVVVDGDS